MEDFGPKNDPTTAVLSGIDIFNFGVRELKMKLALENKNLDLE